MSSAATRATSAPLDPPTENTFEISVFGSGKGESIVVHLGENRWMIVDSLLNPHSKQPVPLEYLRAIGVSPDQVVLLVASHWHDDHIKGIADIYRQTTNAELVLSSAIQTDDFKSFIAGEQDKLKCASVTEEIWQIIREKGKRKRLGKFHFASDNKRLIYRDGIRASEVWSLSPSSNACAYAMQRLARYLPRLGEEHAGSIPRDTANQASVVIWIRVGSQMAILGSDLECENDPTIGWNAIVCSQAKPNERAHFFKIPHHGSVNAYSKDVWRTMMTDASWSVLTPMRSSRIPTREGISLIKQHTNRLWTAAPLLAPSKPKRSRVVERQIQMRTKQRWVQEGPIGQVRYRCDLSNVGEPEVCCFPPAMQL